MSEELRRSFRQQALDSLYFFDKVVLGYQDMTPDLHLPVCDFIQADEQHKLLVLPRGHLKTSICTKGYALWRVCHDPNIRILIANATASNASKMLLDIEGMVEGNEMLRWLFPEIIPEFNKVRWNSTEMEVKRTKTFQEATIEAIGVGGSAVSRHYDLIIEDDLVNEDHILTTEQMQKVVDWHKYAVSLANNPATSETIVVGTRWAFNDVISFVKEHQPYYKQMYRAVLEDGEPIWPERFTPEVIDRVMELQGVKIFSCQYMNDPLHEDPRAFDFSIVRRFREIPPVPLKYVLAIDPAIGQSRKSDYSAIAAVGMDPEFNKYVVDVRRDRWGVDELIDNVFEMRRIWKPTKVGLETVLFQKILLWPFKEAMRRTQDTFTITELRPSTQHTKEGRIATLSEYITNGSLWIRHGLTALEKEMQEFPFGSHDDCLDAVTYAVQLLSPAEKLVVVNENPFQLENILAELKVKNAQQHVESIWRYQEPYSHVSH